MSKAEQIINLFKEGKKPKDIAHQLNCYDSTVYTVIGNYKKVARIKELELLVNKNK